LGKELEPRATDVYLDPDYNDKFQSADLDFLGIGPPSPKFYSRRVPSAPKAPQHPQQQPLLNPEPGSNFLFYFFFSLSPSFQSEMEK
jgi:hypothetical protein